MGLLKKIFKPVSKVLDKIIPNEIKPALPYLAAFAPYIGPMQGIMGSGMIQRALMSGGLNIGAQLAQEGSEGDINLLSAGLASLQGAMTAPGTSAGLPKGMSPGESMARYGTTTGPVAGTGSFTSFTDAGIKKYGADSAMGEILGGAAKASKFMTDPGLAKYSIPAAQGTADLMYAEANRLEDDEDEGSEETSSAGYTDAAYRAAIRKSMEAYGADEEEILAAIEAAGYRSGGRVALRGGGIMNSKRGLVDGPGGYAGEKTGGIPALSPPQAKENKWLSQVSDTKEVDTINRIYEEQGNDGLQAYLDRNPDLKNKYVIVADSMSGELSVMPNKLHPDNIDMEKIIMIGDGQGGNEIDISSMFEEKKAKGGRITPKRGLVDGPGGYAGEVAFGGIGEAIDNVKKNEMAEYYKNFGNDRFISEMFDEYSGLMSGGEQFFDKVDAEIGTGEFPEPEKLKSFKNEYEDLQNKAEIIEDRYSDGFEGRGDEKTDINKLKYYENKEKELEKREDAINERDAELTLNNLDASEITRTPDFQAWLKLYEAKDPRAKSHPYHEEFEDVLMSILPGRNESYLKATDYAAWKKNGGRINKAEGGVPSVLPKGIEADYRGGGFIPIGSRERADDVPARLSENEFVMTADAVRAAGGGSVNKGAKRMYDLMHNLEARA